MSEITPYYERNGISLFCGDCLEIMPLLDETFDAVITDPPYPDYHIELYKQTDIGFLCQYLCRQFVFWSAKVDFPLSYSAIHIWDKKVGCGSQYEKIYERNGDKNYRVFRYYFVNSSVAANYAHDVWTEHKSQKPINLLNEIVSLTEGVILDPFCGSGTTLVAAQNEGRRAVGIELSEDYCKIAVERLKQPSFWSLPGPAKREAEAEQLPLIEEGTLTK